LILGLGNGPGKWVNAGALSNPDVRAVFAVRFLPQRRKRSGEAR
jgi:hypothetical protein